MESQFVETSGELEFEPVSGGIGRQQAVFGVCLHGKHLVVASAARHKLLHDFGLQDCADSLPQTVLIEALNHVLASRLRKAGSVNVWHDSERRLIHVDWGHRQREHIDGVGVFRAAFHSISMKNQHTIRRPGVLVLADLPTHVEVTTDCDKVREVMPCDTVLGGVMLRHSEMGAAPTALFATIFRAFCRNQFVYGFSKLDPRYLGEMRIPVSLNDIAGGLASGLGGLLNRMRRLAHQPCIATEEAIPLLQYRWDLSQMTADNLLAMANDQYLGNASWDYEHLQDFDRFFYETNYDDPTESHLHPNGDRQDCLYDVLNTMTAVTTHRHDNIPSADCGVLERISDSLLTLDSPLQRLLQQDLLRNK